ncbi:hypothetical protein GCM10022198_11570 [Klugiella xanthotipulae]|uniref:ATP/maltotriose-dependent transcriptional regulator MalT n=1 Tax=Klugiella xanthotipulae TaxID=244735 RepID=A0A543HYX9_9MICO|nr:LuxR C-terminal-related transcriptional regulator [Klugiella xanthotipulae]TQM63547.1 ATP/maltotriose-dependent transcriptional regulator MalT [Klugiella xanthotipulae]
MSDSLPLPRVPRDAILRPRLNALLNAELPLTVLRAGGGAGKSTLLAQWLAERAAHTARYLYVELGRRAISRTELLTRIGEHLSRLPFIDDPRGWLRGLAAAGSVEKQLCILVQALEALAEPLTIVIDHYSSASDPASDADILTLLERFRRLRVVVATRSPRQLSGLAVEALVDVAYIESADLFLTPEEAGLVLRGMTGRPVPDGLDLRLCRLPLAARLVGVGLKRSGAEGNAVIPSMEEVSDLLLEYFLADPELSDMVTFLMRVSPAPRVTTALGSLLGETDRAQEFLDRAALDAVGAWAGSPEGPIFSLFPEVRAALQRQAALRIAPELLHVHHDLARWALAAGRYTLALENALAEHDYLFASRVVRESWAHLDDALAAEFLHLLNAVPSADLSGFPTLLVVMGVALTAQGHRSRAAFLLTKALAALDRREQDDDPVEAVWWLALASLAHRTVGNFSQAAQRARRAVQVAPRIGKKQRYEMGASLPLLVQICATSLFYNADYSQAIAGCELSLVYAEPRFPRVMFGSVSLLMGILAFRGDMRRARTLLAQTEAAGPSDELTHGNSAELYRITRALDRLGVGEPAAARAELDSVRAHLGRAEHWAYFCAVDAWIDLSIGAPARALASIDAALVPGAHPKTSPSILSGLLGIRAMALLSEGHVAGAQRQLSDLPAPGPLIVAFRGLSQLVGDQPEKAMATLAETIDRTASATNLRASALARIIYAAAALRLGHVEVAVDAATSALETALVVEGWLAPLMLPRRDLLALREVVTGAAREFVDSFLRSDPPDDLFPIVHRAVPLTARETVLLRELPSGDSLPVIAARLSVSANTVKAQLRTLYRKFGVSSREEAVRAAAESGYFFPGPPTPTA